MENASYSAVAVAKKVGTGSWTVYNIFRDHLGTITHMKTGSTITEYSFDAWGRRRDKDDWSYTLTNEPALFADRGFTSHELLPWFNLYNMNGRLYDPAVGRFLSPDPFVADQTNTQEYNRYSYCLNNPLKYTDPSGYIKKYKKEEERIDIMDYVYYWNSRVRGLGGSSGGGGNNSWVNSCTDLGHQGYDVSTSDFLKAYDSAINNDNVPKTSYIPQIIDYYNAHSYDRGKTFYTSWKYLYSRKVYIPFEVASGQNDGFSSSPVSAVGVLSQIVDNVSTLYNHDTYTQTSGKVAPIRKPNGQLRTSQQALKAIRGSRLLKLGSIDSNGYMIFNGFSSYSDNGLTLRNGSDMVIGTLGTIGAGILLFSNPVGWVATGCIVVGAGSAIYGTATTGYDIYNEITGD